MPLSAIPFTELMEIPIGYISTRTTSIPESKENSGDSSTVKPSSTFKPKSTLTGAFARE